MKKVGCVLIVLILISLQTLTLADYDTQADSIFSVIASNESVEIGDTFYVWVYLDAQEAVDTWVVNLMEYNWTSVGLANVTGIMEGDWYSKGGFGSTGSFHNDWGYIKNPQYFIMSNSTSNETLFRVNFTSLEVGKLCVNLSDIDLQYSGVPKNFICNNATVTIYPQDPASLLATAHNHTCINISFAPGVGDDAVVLCGSNVTYPANPQTDLLYNGTSSPFQHNNLEPCVTYYYRAWGWNETEQTFSPTYRQSYVMSQCYTNFSFQEGNPTNGSITANCSYDISVNTTIINSRGYNFNYWINGSDSSTESGTGTIANSSIAMIMNDLSHETLYWWNVTVTDGNGDWANNSYNFTTGSGGGIAPSIPSNPSPSSSVTNVSKSLNTLLADVSDPDGDTLTEVRFFWSNGTSIDIDYDVASGGTALATISNILDYNTVYSWYVIASDGCLSTQSSTFSFTTEVPALTVTKEWQVHDNSTYFTIKTFVNVTNSGETNLTNLTVTETYDTNLGYVASSPNPDVGDNIWNITSLNISETWNLVLWLNLSNVVLNGTTFSNSVNVFNSTYSVDVSASVPTLTICLSVKKEANMSVVWWNTTNIQYNVTVYNCGDFPLYNVSVLDLFPPNVTLQSSNYGVVNPFNLGQLNASNYAYLYIMVNTSYDGGGDPLVNATKMWNNVTVTSNETLGVADSMYLFVGATTESIRVVYDAYLTDVQGIGTSVMNLLGILLIVGAIFLIVLIVRKADFLRGGK